MNGGFVFLPNAGFTCVIFSEPNSWFFKYGEKAIIVIEGGLWRLLRDGRILYTSNDHLQWFGLPQQKNIVDEVSGILTGSIVTKITISTTGDINAVITGGYQLEVFITSSGYESYSLHVDKKRYIGMGGGRIAVFEES